MRNDDEVELLCQLAMVPVTLFVELLQQIRNSWNSGQGSEANYSDTCMMQLHNSHLVLFGNKDLTNSILN